MAAGIAGAVVVQFEAVLEAVAFGHLHHEVGGARCRAGGDRRLRLDPRQVGQQQHRAFVLAAIERLAGFQHRQRLRHPLLPHRRAFGDIDADVAEHAFADGDPDHAIDHFLHRHEGLHQAEAVLLVHRHRARGELFEIGEGHALADPVRDRRLQFAVGHAGRPVELHALEHEAGLRLRGHLRLGQGLRLLRRGGWRRGGLLRGIDAFGLRERRAGQQQGRRQQVDRRQAPRVMDAHPFGPEVHFATFKRQLPIRLNGAQ